MEAEAAAAAKVWPYCISDSCALKAICGGQRRCRYIYTYKYRLRTSQRRFRNCATSVKGAVRMARRISNMGCVLA
jgi:hypothetical protein